MSSRFRIFVSLLVIFQAMALASSGDVTGGAAIDLRASSLSSQGSGWVNLGTAGGYYLAQDKNDPPPYGTTGDIPWTSGWVDDAESDGDSDDHIWGHSEDADNVIGAPQVGLESFSVELWLERTGANLSNEAQIVGLRSPNHATRFSISLDVSDNTLRVDDMRGSNNDASPDAKPFNTGIVLEDDGSFHHIVFTWDNGSKKLSAYFDGGESPDITFDVSGDANPPDYDSSDIVHWSTVLASYSLEGFRRFQGRVNTVRVYTSALTGAEADANFQAGPATTTNVVRIQNKHNEYTGQENTAMNWAGWAYDDSFTPEDCSDDVAGEYPGYSAPTLGAWNGHLDDLDFDGANSIFCLDGSANTGPRFSVRNLLAFRGLESAVPAGYQVGTAKLVLNQVFHRYDADRAEPTTFNAYHALMPWEDADPDADTGTYWLSWGNGGMDEGYIGSLMDAVPFYSFDQNTALAAGPGGKTSINARGSTYIVLDLDPQVVQGWIDNPSSNHGVILFTPPEMEGDTFKIYPLPEGHVDKEIYGSSHRGLATSAFTMGGQDGPPGPSWGWPGDGDSPALILTQGAAAATTSGAFTAITAGGGSLQVEFTGEASTDYQLQSSSDPVSGTWDNAGSAETSDGSGNISFSDQGGSSGMYRTVEQGEEQ